MTTLYLSEDICKAEILHICPKTILLYLDGKEMWIDHETWNMCKNDRIPVMLMPKETVWHLNNGFDHEVIMLKRVVWYHKPNFACHD